MFPLLWLFGVHWGQREADQTETTGLLLAVLLSQELAELVSQDEGKCSWRLSRPLMLSSASSAQRRWAAQPFSQGFAARWNPRSFWQRGPEVTLCLGDVLANWVLASQMVAAPHLFHLCLLYVALGFYA